MNTTKLPTGSRLGVVAAALVYIAAMFMLFLPTCSAVVELAKQGDSSVVYPMTSIELNGLLCLKFSFAHWAYFLIALLCASMSIPMFGDNQLNVRQAFVGVRCLLIIVAYAMIAAFMLDVITPITSMHPSYKVTIMSFSVLNLGYLVFILATVGLCLTIVSTVLCSTETLDNRRVVFFANSYKKWTPEEKLISVFTALTGGIVSCLPYVWTKNVWKRKYGDPSVRPTASERVVPKRGAAPLDRFAYTAKLLKTYNDLLEKGALTQDEYDQIKLNLLKVSQEAETDSTD